MKIVILIIGFLTSFHSYSNEAKPFALIDMDSEKYRFKSYYIFAPKLKNEQHLTSIQITKEGTLSVSLELNDSTEHPGYKTGYIELSNDLADNSEIIIVYKEKVGAEILPCGGHAEITSITGLLKTE